MSPRKKRGPPANAEILREQIQLLQTEKELKKSLETIKDHINKLLVEELELKSALARSQSTQMYTATPKQEPINPVYQFDSVNTINEQKLNLFPAQRNQSIEEYDEE
ncbi:uncharacterized protein LOC129567743 [Sitodiplosis mosellana]|uniref:uncharacterized protein LOC129567743 n=1 Tax=Sitodiplosis mosellana TaxID=263140 RepID=UPI002444BF7A|nr:uncharacterized protein LOC129567743 [Sitodiplosis mosellana]